MNFKIKLFFTILMVLASTFVYSQELINFSAKNKIELIGTEIEIFEDEKNEFSFTDITSEEFKTKFKKNNNNNLNLGVSKSAFWFRFKVKNNSGRDILLDLGSSVVEDIEFYRPLHKGGFERIKTGTSFEFSSREFNLNTFLFFLASQNDLREIVFYMRVKSEHPIEVPLKIGTTEEFLHYYHRIDLFYGFYVGLMLVMILYNFFVYLSVRDNSYLFYITYLTGALLINTFLLGNYAFEFLWRGAEWINRYFIFWSGFTPIVAVLFSMRFLHTKELAPRIHKLLAVMLLLIPIMQIANLFGLYAEIIEIFQALISLPTLVLLFAALYIYKNGYKPAFLFFLGWLIYILGIVIFVLSMKDILPGTFLFKNAVIVGQEIEVVIFAFALGAKINQLRKDKTKAQAEALTQARENERIVKEQNQILEGKVKERTAELEEKNDTLEEMNQEILSQQHELLAINEKLSSQYNEIEEINQVIDMTYKQLRASIEYAKSIQTALLPFEGRIALSLKEYFVLYKPKDIVSGDFYWVQDLAIKKFSKESDTVQKVAESDYKSSKVVIAVADCTGHGVPGAFMSMIGNELLSQIININDIISPDEILYHLHLGIRFALRQDETSSRDGMDISVCVWDKANNTIEYAGAMNPLYYFKSGELHEIKADKTPIGGYQKENERTFVKHTVKIDSSVMFYLCTDGYQDQFGGENDKKFMSKRLRVLLAEISALPLKEQERKLDEVIEDWKGGRKQTDDITIFGFRLNTL